MARPTTTGLQGTPGYAPRQQGATQRAQVHADLNVRTGKSGAEHLADALGLVQQTVNPIIKQKVAEKAADQTTAGMRDAQQGKVDAKRAAEDEYYDRGQKKVLTDRATLDALNEWDSKLAKGEIDRTNVEKLRAQYEQFMQERLSSFLGDPEAARWALEKLAPHEAQTLAALHKEQVEAYRADTIAVVGEGLRRDVQAGAPVNLEAYKQQLITAGFTKAQAAAELVKIAGQTAIERKEPELLANLFPEDGKWADGTPGPRSTPALLEEINTSAYYAGAQRDAADREAKRKAEEKATADVSEATILAASGNIAGARAIVDPLLRAGLIDRAEYQSIVNFGRGSLGFYREESLDPTAIARWRADLAEGKYGTEREALMAARALVPGGADGARYMQQLADDSTSYFRARENDSNPLARAYRQNLAARHGAPSYAQPGDPEAERAAAILLTFDKELARTGDPDKAMEAAERVAKAAPPAERKPGSGPVVVVNGVPVIKE